MGEMNRENAREIEFYGRTLEDCVIALLNFQSKNESVVINFNGHKLYSCDVTMDSAYQEVMGKTKAEFEKAQAEWREKYKREQEEEKANAEANVPAWIERGNGLIYPEREDEWKECVEARAADLYHGKELDCALEIMEKLENGASLDEAKEILDNQGHSGMSYELVRNIVFAFSKQGPEFLEHTAEGELSQEDKKLIEDKKKENEMIKIFEGNSDEKEEDKKALFGIYSKSFILRHQIADVNNPRLDTQEFIKQIAGDKPISGFYYDEYDENGKPYSRSVYKGVEMPLKDYIEELKKRGLSFEVDIAKENFANNPDAKVVIELNENGEMDFEHSEGKIIEPRDIVVSTDDELWNLYNLRKQKDNAVEVDIDMEKYDNTIESAVKTLEDYRKRGESVYISFNGHKLYSCDVTMDGAYQDIVGQTKGESDRAQEEWREKYKREQEEARAKAEEKVPTWIEKGNEYIYPEREEEWKECVEASVDDLYHGRDLDYALEIMEKLDNGASFEEVKEILDNQGHSGASYGIVRNMIFAFSKQGPEFIEYISNGDLSPDDKELIENKKRENAELEELHKDNSTKVVSQERRDEEKELKDNKSQKEKLSQEISELENQIAELNAKLEEKKQALNNEQPQSGIDDLE